LATIITDTSPGPIVLPTGGVGGGAGLRGRLADITNVVEVAIKTDYLKTSL
jgi:hypothetical protein